jgi:hypothetical protein
MELIINSKKYGKFIVLYDDEDHDKISKYKWHVKKMNKRNSLIYAATNVKENGRRGALMLHRLITNCQDNKMVDHINHNSLDNRKSNLRICTNSENKMNSKSYKNSTSRFKGVAWYNRDKKWRSYIMKDYKCIWLGLFENEIDAALAYNCAAIKYHGEFACLNEVL